MRSNNVLTTVSAVLVAAMVAFFLTSSDPARGDNDFAFWQDLLRPADRSCAVWGELNGDDQLDVAVTGQTVSGRYLCVYLCGEDPDEPVEAYSINVNGVVNESSDGIALGDYDLDGDLDIAMAGDSDSGRLA